MDLENGTRERSLLRGCTAIWIVGAAACGGETGTEPGERRGSDVHLTSITAGAWHSCAIEGQGDGAGPELHNPPGRAWCWGRNDAGQLGRVGGPDVGIPGPVLDGGPYVLLAAGERFTCGLAESGAVDCWGASPVGPGNGMPRRVQEVTPAVGLAAGDGHACAIDLTGGLWCWGRNDRGQLGDGTQIERPTPRRVAGGPVGQVAAGANHTCVIGLDQAVRCWGSNTSGQLGRGVPLGGQTSVPVSVPSDVQFQLLSGGDEHTCGMTVENRTGGKPVRCFGGNAYGQLGRAGLDPSAQAEEVFGELAFRAVAVGGRHVCGIVHSVDFTQEQAPNNVLFCWGDNREGQGGAVGPGEPGRLLPRPVTLDREWQGVAAGRAHSCGISGDVAFCWGANGFGQLGIGGTAVVEGLAKVAVGSATVQ